MSVCFLMAKHVNSQVCAMTFKSKLGPDIKVLAKLEIGSYKHHLAYHAIMYARAMN